MLTDLDKAVARSGLVVKALPDWKNNFSNGGQRVGGVLIHHTGAFDDIFDGDSDLEYAKWLAFKGRHDLPPPLCNLALSAEGVVYLCAAGNANHGGKAKASGPMSATSDAGYLYIGIEAMNSGTQGWGKKGKDASGKEITQYEAYVRLCAALCVHYGWPASHVRAHYETSLTGKWDPGDPKGVLFNGQRVMDMNKFRAAVAEYIKVIKGEEIDMASAAELERLLRVAIKEVRLAKKMVLDLDGDIEALATDEKSRAILNKRREDRRLRNESEERELDIAIAEAVGAELPGEG